MDSYGNEFVQEKKIPAVFPKALEPYDTKPIENDFGLTSTEVLSLKAGWAMIKKKQHQASLSTYVNLFTEHYELYELFRDPQGHLNVQLAALHQKMVLHVFQLVIEHLNDARFVRSLLKDVASKHKKVPVSNYQWQTVSQEDNDPGARNPMLYDPLQDGVVKTSKKMQYFAALVVCLGAVSAGTALAWTSPVLPQISAPPPNTGTESNSTITNSTISNSTISNTTTPATPAADSSGLQLTLEQQTWVSSLVAIGAFVGALPTGYIADAIGRRYTALVMDVPFIVAWLAIIFAKSAGMLYFGRFVIGVSTGSFCVVAPMYISEIAETSIRGTLGTLFQLLLTFGILLVYLIGAVVSWTTLSVLCLMVPIALFIGMLILPETPTYLLKKGRRGDAALSLKWLWGRYCDSRSAIQMIQADLDQAGSDASFMDLFRNRAAFHGLIISMLLMFFQQFSGINAVIFYTVPIFQSAGSTLDPSVCSIIVGFVQVVMTLASSLLIERAGRKVLLLFSSTMMTICLAVLGIYFQMKDSGKDVSSIGWLPLLCVVLFMIVFSVGYGPIPWMMMGELFLPDVKATAVALTVMSNWFSVFVVTKCFGSMITAWGSDMTFWFFGFCMLSATLYVAFMVLETKGRSSAQIQMWLSGGKL